MERRGRKSGIAKAVFWTGWPSILLAYIGYPGMLFMLRCFHRQGVRKERLHAKVSILIAAHNEEECIGRTIENKLGLNYPRESMEVIVISDGSMDRTEEIVRSYGEEGVRLIRQNPRQGKTAALNVGVEEAKGEIIVFSDANSIYEKDALDHLVRNFSDPRVGYVTGKMVYVDKNGSVVGAGCGAYMRYENILRSLETDVGSIVGVDGGIDAVRRCLYEPMTPDSLPDFVLPLSVVAKGYRVVYEEKALLKENSLTEVKDETRMRIRVMLRSFHALWRMRRLLDPRVGGLFSFQLFTHKILRYSVGHIQLALLASNAFLLGWGSIYRAFFTLQTGFYLLALAGFVRSRRKSPSPSTSNKDQSRLPVPQVLARTERAAAVRRRPVEVQGNVIVENRIRESPALIETGYPDRKVTKIHARGQASTLIARASQLACYLCLLNACSIAASVMFLRGKKVVVWQPRKG